MTYNISIKHSITGSEWSEKFNTLQAALSVLRHQVDRYSQDHTSVLVFRDGEMDVDFYTGTTRIIEIEFWEG